MRTFALSALVLGAMTSIALAGEPANPSVKQLSVKQEAPVTLTDAQMATIVGGRNGNNGWGNGGSDGLNNGSFHGNTSTIETKSYLNGFIR
jgi:hypothetical protein